MKTKVTDSLKGFVLTVEALESEAPQRRMWRRIANKVTKRNNSTWSEHHRTTK